jgi:hypothetical protein
MQALHPASDKPPLKPPTTAHASRPLAMSLLLLYQHPLVVTQAYYLTRRRTLYIVTAATPQLSHSRAACSELMPIFAELIAAHPLTWIAGERLSIEDEMAATYH